MMEVSQMKACDNGSESSVDERGCVGLLEVSREGGRRERE